MLQKGDRETRTFVGIACVGHFCEVMPELFGLGAASRRGEDFGIEALICTRSFAGA